MILLKGVIFCLVSWSILLSSAELFLYSLEEFIYEGYDFEAFLALIFLPTFPEKAERFGAILVFAIGVELTFLSFPSLSFKSKFCCFLK